MSQKLTMIFTAVVASVCLGVIVITFDPFQAAGYVKTLFYVSFFTIIWSGGTILFFYLRPGGDNRFESAFKIGFLLSLVILVIFLGLRWLKM